MLFNITQKTIQPTIAFGKIELFGVWVEGVKENFDVTGHSKIACLC